MHLIFRIDAGEADAQVAQPLRTVFDTADVVQHHAGSVVAVGTGEDVVFYQQIEHGLRV